MAVNNISNFGYDTYGSLFNNYSIGSSPYDSNFSFPRINTSTEKFKGNVTGYKPVKKTGPSTSTGYASDDARSYLAAVKDFGSRLRAATASLSQAGQSVFNKTTGVSSENDVLSVRVSNQADSARFYNAGDEKKVSIRQLAASQRNTSTALNAMAPSRAAAGINRFSIEKGGKSYDFSVNINATDSNRTAQYKMADAINARNIGIKATVDYDDKSRKSTLVLSSDDTGEKNAFTIADGNRGDLVEKLGAAKTTQEARDAQYTVDGEAKTSASNTVDLGDGLTGTLKKAGSDEVKVSVRKDVEGITDAVTDMITQFNGLLKTTKSLEGDRGADALRQQLDSVADSYASSLKHLGITRDQDGYLEADEKKLKAAFEDGSAERHLGNDSMGFTQRLSKIAKQADSDPNRYLSYQSRRSLETEAAEDTLDYEKEYYNFMSSYQNQQWANTGLLLSMGV